MGIETEIENLEWAQWLEEVFRGKDYGLTIVSHTEPMDIGIYANPDYYFQYDNPDFQALMETLTATTDPAARSEILAKAQTIISEDYVNGYLFELAYPTVAKAGLLTFTRTAAQALGPKVRVNAIGPGPTIRGARESEVHFFRQRAACILGRGSDPEDIVAAMRFILSCKALTGQMLAIDGGQHLGWETPDLGDAGG